MDSIAYRSSLPFAIRVIIANISINLNILYSHKDLLIISLKMTPVNVVNILWTSISIIYQKMYCSHNPPKTGLCTLRGHPHSMSRFFRPFSRRTHPLSQNVTHFNPPPLKMKKVLRHNFEMTHPLDFYYFLCMIFKFSICIIVIFG